MKNKVSSGKLLFSTEITLSKHTNLKLLHTITRRYICTTFFRWSTHDLLPCLAKGSIEGSVATNCNFSPEFDTFNFDAFWFRGYNNLILLASLVSTCDCYIIIFIHNLQFPQNTTNNIFLNCQRPKLHRIDCRISLVS